jgi:hypothetical protein
MTLAMRSWEMRLVGSWGGLGWVGSLLILRRVASCEWVLNGGLRRRGSVIKARFGGGGIPVRTGWLTLTFEVGRYRKATLEFGKLKDHHHVTFKVTDNTGNG